MKILGSAWLGVVSAEHVRRGVTAGIAQIGHGKRGGLARMHAGDTLIYYSPTERLGDRTALQQFTAVGTISDHEIWQADEDDFKPFRRRVTYEDRLPVPLAAIKAQLVLASTPNWGYQLRRGLIELTAEDAATIRNAMVAVAR